MKLKDGASYVIRQHSAEQTQKTIDKEFFAFECASKNGIAPQVFAISSDRKAILMGYVQGSPFIPPTSKDPLFIQKMAHAIRLAHSMERNLYAESGFKARIESMYHEVMQRRGDDVLINEAITIFRDEITHVESSAKMKVMIHGDLNPHNIILSDGNIFLIDWSEARLDDPFFDLSFYSLLQGYTHDEERILLKAYLDQSLVSQEMQRCYDRAKKANLAALCISCQWVMMKMIESLDELDLSAEPKSWNYYTDLFSSRSKSITPQIFLEFSRAALQYAKAVE